MANTKISALGAATALAGTETIPGVQSGVTVKLTPAQIKTYVNTSPSFTGDSLWASDNTHDIGAFGANRPRDLFLGRNQTVGGYINVPFFYLGTGASRFGGTADGVYQFGNNALTQSVSLTVGASNLATLNGGLTTAGQITAGTSVKPGSYTVATVPSASAAGAGAEIYVSNESGGGVTAFSDATNWRRVTDRAIIT